MYQLISLFLSHLFFVALLFLIRSKFVRGAVSSKTNGQTIEKYKFVGTMTTRAKTILLVSLLPLLLFVVAFSAGNRTAEVESRLALATLFFITALSYGYLIKLKYQSKNEDLNS